MKHPAPPATITNRLLDWLPARDRAHVVAGCETVDLAFADVVDEPGDSIPHVYFPTVSFISLVTPMEGKNRLEVALAGSEGMYGVPVGMGVRISPAHAIVQGAGLAWRIGSARFARELSRTPSLRNCVARYTFVLMSQLIRTAACSRFHRIEQRLARWLLMTADRAHSPSFHITHEFLASMLGVRRVGITEAASALRARGLIAYNRGTMTIRNRKGLELASCSCYRSDLSIYERVLHKRISPRQAITTG